MAAAAETALVWTGCYSQDLGWVHGTGTGLVAVEVDLSTGALSEPEGVKVDTQPLPNPTYMTPTANGVVVVCEEYGELPDCDNKIHAYKFGSSKRELVKINDVVSKGTGCCHCIATTDGRHVLAANYMSGSTIVHDRAPSGTLGACTFFHQYEGGTGVNPVRQEAAHAHQVFFDPDERFVYVPDLGADLVRGYHWNGETGVMIPDVDLELTMPPGSGPRHMVFHPTLPVAYVLNELLSTLSTCSVDPASGKLKILSTTTTLPDGVPVEASTCAAIRITADGTSLYASNRGHDSIVHFSVAADGTATLNECVPVGGKTPRDFALLQTASGAQPLLLAAAQDSDVMFTFRVGEGGKLTPTGHSIPVKTPVVLCQV